MLGGGVKVRKIGTRFGEFSGVRLCVATDLNRIGLRGDQIGGSNA